MQNRDQVELTAYLSLLALVVVLIIVVATYETKYTALKEERCKEQFIEQILEEKRSLERPTKTEEEIEERLTAYKSCMEGRDEEGH